VATIGRQAFASALRRMSVIASEKVLKAVILEAGQNRTSAEVLRAHGVAASTTHKTLGILDEKGIVRKDEVSGATRYRLEDPFLGAWLRHAQDM
jgi:hypothetical protein